jgi:hypothetical protein
MVECFIYGGNMHIGDLIMVHIDIPKGLPDFSFIALVVSTGSMIECYSPAENKSYVVPWGWCTKI